MKTFLIKICVFSSAIACAFLLLISMVNVEKVDNFYAKFLTSRQNSIALGSSRGAQGFVPSEFSVDEVFNFAFTLSNSPYGEVYERAISQKLITDSPGTLILEVNPVVLSYYFQNNPFENPKLFREVDKHLDRLTFFNLKPNIDYLICCYEGPMVNLFFNEPTKVSAKEDGWMKINIDSAELFENRQLNVKKGIEAYGKVFQRLRHSNIRIESLERIIRRYKTNKDIYLVRFPLSKEMLELENSSWEAFGDVMNQIAESHGVKYLDFSKNDEEFLTNDVHHLNYEYAKRFTRYLNDTIKAIKYPGVNFE